MRIKHGQLEVQVCLPLRVAANMMDEVDAFAKRMELSRSAAMVQLLQMGLARARVLAPPPWADQTDDT